jgi:hypothetical protein
MNALVTINQVIRVDVVDSVEINELDQEIIVESNDQYYRVTCDVDGKQTWSFNGDIEVPNDEITVSIKKVEQEVSEGVYLDVTAPMSVELFVAMDKAIEAAAWECIA